MGLAMLGMVFVWCTFPIVTLSNLYNSNKGAIVALMGQVNMWMALSGSALGVFAATSFYFRKFSVHELIFTSITVFLCLFRVE